MRDGRSFALFWDQHSLDSNWDDFLVTVPNAHHEQLSCWGIARSILGWKVERLLIEEGGRIIGGVQIQTRAVRRVGIWAYVTYGPCFLNDDLLVGSILVSELTSILEAKRVLYVLVIAPYHGNGIADHLRRAGYLKPVKAIAPFYMQSTLVLDLRRTESELLAGMRHDTRKHVRQGMKRGVLISKGGQEDLGEFWRLMKTLCARRKTVPNPSIESFFPALWQGMSKHDWIRLYLGRLNDEPVSAAIAFPFGDWFRVWKVGWSGAHGNLMPNHALHWAMVQDAKQDGYRFYDFVNLDLSSKNSPNGSTTNEATASPQESVTRFKLGFGGTVIRLPGAYCYYLNPLLRIASRFGLLRLLDSSIGVRMARAVSNSGRGV